MVFDQGLDTYTLAESNCRKKLTHMINCTLQELINENIHYWYQWFREMLMQNADLLIWLDYPFFKIFWQTIKRTLRRLVRREPCCNGNYETFRRQFFSKYSIFWWVISTYKKRRRDYTALMQQPTCKHKWVVVRNAREREELLGFCVIPNSSSSS